MTEHATPEMIDAAEENIRADHRAGKITKKQFQKEMLIMARARQQARAPSHVPIMQGETAASISKVEAAAPARGASISTFKAHASDLPIANLGGDLSLPGQESADFQKPANFARNCQEAAPKVRDLSPEDTAIAVCEACGKHIQEGEPYLCGPETDFCCECAPTYQALLDEPEGFVNSEGEQLTQEQCRAWFDQHISAGGKASDSMATVDRNPAKPLQEREGE